MMQGNTVTVDESEHGHFPEGMTATVERVQTNQFSGREVLDIEWDSDEWSVPNRDAAPRAQLNRNTGETEWTEVHSGLDREHERLTFEEG